MITTLLSSTGLITAFQPGSPDEDAPMGPAVPEPTLRPGLDETEVTPGIEGFLFTALMVAMAIIIIRLMIRSVRRVQLRSETAEEMLVDRHQSYLPADERQYDPEQRRPSRVERLREKYPGYLDSPPPTPKAPDSGRD